MGQERSERARVVALVVIVILGSCLGSVSQTALNAMFSGITADFGIEAAQGQWVTTLYMLVLGITVPAVTFLMRRFTSRALVLASLALLLVGGMIDAVAPSFIILIVGRVLQAVASGITMPMMMTIVMTSFAPGRQATVMGIAGIAMGFAPNIGPTIGGFMLAAWGWRSFFAALCLATLLLIVLTLAVVPRQGATGHHAHLDAVSLLYSALGFGGLLLGFSNASSFGLASLHIWVPVALGAVFLVLFLRRQRRIEWPLIDLRIFGSRHYRAGFWASNFLFASFMAITLILPLYVEDLCGGSSVQAGMALLPGTVAALFINPLAGYLTDKVGVRPVTLVFSVFLALGACSMAFMDETTPFWLVLVLQSVRATGVSGLIGPLTSWSLTGLSHEIVSDGSSFSTATRQACASLGTALMVFAITLGTGALGYHAAFGISAVFACATLALCVVKVRDLPPVG